MKGGSTPDDEEVFISGWFSREIMEKLLCSGLSKTFSIFLYRGENGAELETDWYLSADSFWGKQRNRLLSSTRRALNRLGIKPSNAFDDVAAPFRKENDPDNSITHLIANIEDEEAAFEAAKQGEESHLARPVYFSNGSHKWLRVSSSEDSLGGDALIVVNQENETTASYARKTAAMLHPGDIVLRMEASDSALDSLCKENFSSYGEVLRIAKSWRDPIERAKKSMEDGDIVRRIANAGVSKHESTIRSWVRGNIAIAPNGESGRKDIAAIGLALGQPFSDDEIRRILQAGKIIRGKRIESGRSISKGIAQSFVSDVSRYGFQDAMDGFSSRHESGKIDLLCVDHIGKTQNVPIGRLGYYIE